MEEALSVGQLHRKVRNTLAREFRGNVWVTGEIKTLREHRGSLYISLVEPGDYADGGDTSLDVACWPKRRAVLQKQLADAGITLVSGIEVRVSGLVTISKIGRLQLELAALDTEALVGRQEAEKRRLYKTLRDEGIFDNNRRRSVSPVPLKVGLITSQGSEGHADFMGQLERSGFAFHVMLAHSPVQGPTAAALIARSVGNLANEALDVIAIVRGGGGELDAFDKEPVARAILASPIPVWTGIGHTGDRSVGDDVAHTSFITPTECGQGLVSVVSSFMRRADAALEQTARLVERQIHLQRVSLHRYGDRVMRSTQRDLAISHSRLHELCKSLERTTVGAVENSRSELLSLTNALIKTAAVWHKREVDQLKTYRMQVSTFDPKLQLARGYSITKTKDGAVVKDPSSLSTGDEIVTMFASGSTHSVVTDVD